MIEIPKRPDTTDHLDENIARKQPSRYKNS